MLCRGQLLGDLELLDDRAPQPRRRPTQRIRTPHSCSWSRRRRMTSRLKPMRKRTSSGTALPVLGRERVGRQVRDADLDGARRRRRAATPRPPRGPWCAAGRAALAQRPLPSMTIGDVLGHAASAGCAGGRAPLRVREAAWRHGLRWRVVARRVDRAHARSTRRSDRRPRSRCHWRKAATRPLPSRRCRASRRVGDRPVAGEQRREQLEGLGRRARREPGGRHTGAHGAAGGEVERPVRPGRTAPGAVVEARRPAGDRERAQQVGVEHQAGVVLAARPASAARRRAGGTAAARLALLGEPVARSRASRSRAV